MGNKQSADRLPPNHQKDDVDLVINRLQHAMQKWLPETKSAITKEDLKELFSASPAYGELMFDHMCATNHMSNSDITRETFLSCAKSTVLLQLLSDKCHFYFKVFSHNKQHLHTDDCMAMFRICYAVVLYSSGLETKDDGTSWKSACESLCKSNEAVDCRTFVSWVAENCSQLLRILHSYTFHVLYEGTQSNQLRPSATRGGGRGGGGGVMTQMCNDEFLLTLPVYWLLSSSLRQPYMPQDTSTPQVDVSLTNNWQLLYSSNEQGLSANRFQHHVEAYKGPTVTLIQFSGHLYSLAVDVEWRNTSQRWGANCYLHEILPCYRLVEAGPHMVYMNMRDRRQVKGMHIGQDAQRPVLKIDADFSHVTHCGVSLPLQTVEVWGCADTAVLYDQQKQKQWEQKDVEKQQNKKLTLEEWQNSADRELLKMAGIQTEHSQR